MTCPWMMMKPRFNLMLKFAGQNKPMALPRFYLHPDSLPPQLASPDALTGSSGTPPGLSGMLPGLSGTEIGLDEESSRHIVQVLRMKPGEELQLADGGGNLLTAVITEDHKKKCWVRVLSGTFQPPSPKKIAL